MGIVFGTAIAAYLAHGIILSILYDLIISTRNTVINTGTNILEAVDEFAEKTTSDI